MKNTANKENAVHSTKLVPYSYYKCDYKAHCGYVSMHWHNEFEINYIIRGATQFRFADCSFVAKNGDIVIIAPNVVHSLYPFEDFHDTHDTIVFSGEVFGLSGDDRSVAAVIRPIISGAMKITPHITVEKPCYNEAKKCVETVFKCVKQNSAQHDLLLKAELLRLIWLLSTKGEINKTARKSGDEISALKPAADYIAANFKDDITIAQLAELSHLSKSYFMSLFKRNFGIGAMEYIIELRIKSACEALRYTDKTITRISSESGFNNLSNFNRIFKKIVGCTPKEYRKYH